MHEAARSGTRSTAPLPPRAASVVSGIAASAATALVVAIAGCTPAPEAPVAVPGGLPDGVRIELLQQRSDRAPGRVQIRVVNASDAELDIVSARLDGGPLASPVDWARAPATVRPGAVVNLPVRLPELLCTEGSDVVSVTVGLADGTVVVVEPDDPLEAVEGLREAACASSRVEETVAVRAVDLIEDGSGGSSTARLVVEMAPTGNEPVVDVREIAPTVLITSPDTRPWTLDARFDGTTRATVRAEIELRPRRCDAHALAEDKVGTLFAVRVLVAGSEQSIPLPLADGLSDRILAFVSRSCGLDG